MQVVRDVFLKKGKNECVEFLSWTLSKDLEFEKERARDAYAELKKNSKSVDMISTELVEKHRAAIAKYEESVEKFIGEIKALPNPKLLKNILLCVFFLMIGMSGFNSLVCMICFGISIINGLIIINKVTKLYIKNPFEKIQELYEEIEEKHFHNVCIATNLIVNEVQECIWKRRD